MTQANPAQSAGAVEYTNCISEKRKDPVCNVCSGYDMKQSNGEASALDLSEMWSSRSLPLLPGSLWPVW